MLVLRVNFSGSSRIALCYLVLVFSSALGWVSRRCRHSTMGSFQAIDQAVPYSHIFGLSASHLRVAPPGGGLDDGKARESPAAFWQCGLYQAGYRDRGQVLGTRNTNRNRTSHSGHQIGPSHWEGNISSIIYTVDVILG